METDPIRQLSAAINDYGYNPYAHKVALLALKNDWPVLYHAIRNVLMDAGEPIPPAWYYND